MGKYNSRCCQPRSPPPLLPTYLVVDSVQLVVEGHGQVGGRAGGHVRDEGGLALVHGVIHVHPTLANLHVLETRFDTVRAEGRDSGIREREEGNVGKRGENGERKGENS